MGLWKFFQKVPKEIKYVLLLFLTTRIALTIIGVISRILLEPFHGKEYVWVYSSKLWLDIWGVWDTGWYLTIAKEGYLSSFNATVQSEWAFFPLYPWLMRLFGKITGNPYVAGIIISNICLILAAIYLYKLVSLDSDKQTSLKSVKYLFIFPTAFILSGVFTESLFLVLAIMCFYYARKSDWIKAGISGLFLSATRSLGVLIIIPLFYEYLEGKKFKIKNIRKDALWLLLIPLGLIIFAVYNYYKTGDFLAFMHAQQAWGRHLVNPITQLTTGIVNADLNIRFASYFIIICLLLLIVFYKKIRVSYLILGLYSILVPMSITTNSILYANVPRYILAAFPLFIIFAKVSEKYHVDQMITIFLTLIQGMLMVFWANGFHIII